MSTAELSALYSPYPGLRRTRRPLGDPTPLACTVAKEAIEVALGGNGIDRLVRWISPEVRTSLLRQHSLARRAGVAAGPIRIVRARVCRVGHSAAEVSVVAMDGTRPRAVAMRFEEVAGKWLATVIEIG